MYVYGFPDCFHNVKYATYYFTTLHPMMLLWKNLELSIILNLMSNPNKIYNTIVKYSLSLFYYVPNIHYRLSKYNMYKDNWLIT